MKLRLILLSLALLAAVPVVAAGPSNPDPAAVTSGTYSVDPGHTRVRFSVSHMGFTDWYGDFSGATGSLVLNPADLGPVKVDISIPTASVLTINSKLDSELKGSAWFDAATYPTIRFISAGVTRTGPATADIAGDLTFHGVTRPVMLKARFNGAGVNPLSHAYTAGFNATTVIKRTDFGVKTYVPLIGDEVTIEVSAAFEKKAG